jgi:hypothetical protein
VRRLLSLAVLAGAALAAGAAPAQATNECRGLMVCVKVRGPWVVVPAGRSAPRQRVEYQLSCPRGYLVGGLDAELSDRRIDVSFVGKLGSPVNPGITTSRNAVFVATYVGAAARTPTFRPHIGCIPATGGGGRIPTSLSVFPPGEPTARHVRTARIRAGAARRVTARCAAGERLVGGSHAIGFYTRKPPDALLVASVSARRSVRDGRVEVVVRAARALGRARAVVQVSAICAGGQ